MLIANPVNVCNKIKQLPTQMKVAQLLPLQAIVVGRRRSKEGSSSAQGGGAMSGAGLTFEVRKSMGHGASGSELNPIANHTSDF
jgi:hypothetical protein